jgi:hypothetical protein
LRSSNRATELPTDVVYRARGRWGGFLTSSAFFVWAAAQLRADERVFIHEIHSVAEMLPCGNAEKGGLPAHQ